MKKWFTLWLDSQYKISKLKQYLTDNGIYFEPASAFNGIMFSVYTELETAKKVNAYLDTI